MSEERTVQTPAEFDPALLATHPELAVLALDLPDSDGEPVENERERLQMLLLLDVLSQYWHDRQDYYAGGNMFVYYSAQQARQILAEVADPERPRRAFRGPDLFVVMKVDGSFRRQKWVVWEEEGRYPDVIFEFLSPSTRRTDQTTKKTLYEQIFKTREYYWYDPFDAREFQGWQLDMGNGYRAVTPDARGWMWSTTLHLWIGRWDGTYNRDLATWLRFYDPEGRLLLTSQEMAETAEQRADAAEQRADAAEQQAETEHTRALAAEAELTRLRADLARLRGESH
jgi:Uma2 family endonuclease